MQKKKKGEERCEAKGKNVKKENCCVAVTQYDRRCTYWNIENFFILHFLLRSVLAQIGFLYDLCGKVLFPSVKKTRTAGNK